MVGRLTEALASDADSGVRRHATQALGSIDDLDGPALDQLARALQDVCPDVRRNAALALRNAGAGSAALSASAINATAETVFFPTLPTVAADLENVIVTVS